MSEQGADVEDTEEVDTTVEDAALNFRTKKKKTREVLVASIDGHKVTCLQPKDAFTVNIGRDSLIGTPEQRAAAQERWIDTVFDEKSAKHIRKRLDDPDDEFDIDDLTDITTSLITRWGRRPTKKSSGSSGRSKQTGRRSTARSR